MLATLPPELLKGTLPPVRRGDVDEGTDEIDNCDLEKVRDKDEDRDECGSGMGIRMGRKRL